MDSLEQACAAWLEAKEAEKAATEARRNLEDAMLSLIGIPETQEGTTSAAAPGYKISITTRHTRKVDAELVQEIAAEHGTQEHLSRLFRWSPSIHKRAWEATDASITGPLADAIITKPGRPSFKIEKEQ